MEKDNLSINPIEKIKVGGGMTAIFRTLGCIGDSLSSGETEFLNKDGKIIYNDYYEYSWGQFIARQCGIKVYNFSVGGLTAEKFHQYADFNRCFTKEKVCQAYTIALGVNDTRDIINGKLSLGDFLDVDFNDWHNNKNTFVGEYIKIVQRIIELEPNAKIFLITPPKNDRWDKGDEWQTIFEQIAGVIREIPNKFKNTYVVDLRKYHAVEDQAFKDRYYLGHHLNAMGYKYYADVIATYVDYIVTNNYDEFKKVALIGKVADVL